MPLTMQDLENEIARLKAENDKIKANGSNGSKGIPRTIKVNKSGGLFIRDPEMKAFSESKGKQYVASVNVPKEVARVLFVRDSDLLDHVIEFVENNMATG